MTIQGTGSDQRTASPQNLEHEIMKTRSFTWLLAAAFILCATPTRAAYNDAEISPLNYPLRSALKANTTYAGVLIAVQPVKVQHYRRGLLPLFVTAVTDAVVGTRLAEVSTEAMAYTIRLDNPAFRTFQMITVVQGPQSQSQLPLNQPVLVVTEDFCRFAYEGGYRQGFNVRVAPYANPDTMRTLGITEKIAQGK